MGLALGAWAFLFIACFTAFGYCWMALRMMLRHLPISTDRARSIAKDWTTIGAFVLCGWSILSLATGPDYPIAAGLTSLGIGGLLLLASQRIRKGEPKSTGRNRMRTYLLLWLAITMVSVLLAYGVLWGALAMMAQNPDPGPPRWS